MTQSKSPTPWTSFSLCWYVNSYSASYPLANSSAQRLQVIRDAPPPNSGHPLIPFLRTSLSESTYRSRMTQSKSPTLCTGFSKPELYFALGKSPKTSCKHLIMYSMYCPNLSLQSGSLNKDSSGLRVKWSSQAAVFHHTGHWFSPTLEALVPDSPPPEVPELFTTPPPPAASKPSVRNGYRRCHHVIGGPIHRGFPHIILYILEQHVPHQLQR